MHGNSKIAEWRAMWPLPLVAMLGVTGTGIFSFTSGVFMDEMIREFGWSRAAFSSGMTGYLVLSFIGLPLLGRAIDRFGPRTMALVGIGPAALGMAILGFADGNLWQWRVLMLLQATGCVMVSVPVWITAVVERFQLSRGLAIAVVLAGTGVSTAMWPNAAAFFVQHLGWRLAFPAIGASWFAVMLPLTLIFFHGGRERLPAALKAREPRPPIMHLLLSRTFLCLAGSGGLFITASYGMMLHLVPILRWGGHTLTGAAMIAGLAGIFSILGRIIAGFLLDILPPRIFGVFVFLLPAAASLLILYGGGSMTSAIAAAVLLGLSMGAESDILTYIASRRFEPVIFGSVYSVVQSVFSVTSVGGSIAAGALFDLGGSYSPVLLAVLPLTALGALLLWLMPSGRDQPA